MSWPGDEMQGFGDLIYMITILMVGSQISGHLGILLAFFWWSKELQVIHFIPSFNYVWLLVKSNAGPFLYQIKKEQKKQYKSFGTVPNRKFRFFPKSEYPSEQQPRIFG